MFLIFRHKCEWNRRNIQAFYQARWYWYHSNQPKCKNSTAFLKKYYCILIKLMWANRFNLLQSRQCMSYNMQLFIRVWMWNGKKYCSYINSKGSWDFWLLLKQSWDLQLADSKCKHLHLSRRYSWTHRRTINEHKWFHWHQCIYNTL